MNLIFHDRSSSSHPAEAGRPMLAVRKDGSCTLSSGAVSHFKLSEHRWVSLAQDTDTGTFFLLFGEGSPQRKPFALRPTKKQQAGNARCFNAAVQARLLYAAFAVQEEKSMSLAVGAPVTHEAGALYPLSLPGTSLPANLTTPVAAVEPAPEAAAPEAATPVAATPIAANESDETEAPATTGTRRLWLQTEIEYLRQQYPTSSVAAIAAHLGRTEAATTFKAGQLKLHKRPATAPDSPAPVAADEQPIAAEPATEPTTEQPRKTFGLLARAAELTQEWKERELSAATPNQLGEILNLLRHVPKEKRDFEMGLVLDRAELEHTNRLRGAGKEVRRG